MGEQTFEFELLTRMNKLNKKKIYIYIYKILVNSTIQYSHVHCLLIYCTVCKEDVVSEKNISFVIQKKSISSTFG